MPQTDINDTNSTFISLPSVPASTYQAKYFVIDSVATVAESSSQLQDLLEELEWNKIATTPRVRSGLRRLAAEALQEFATGETEEGGFAIE
jgi:hypothetical protein